MEDSNVPLCPSTKRVEQVRTEGQRRWLRETRLIWKQKKGMAFGWILTVPLQYNFFLSFMQSILENAQHQPLMQKTENFIFLFRQIPMSLSNATQCKSRKKLVLARSCVFKNNLNDPLLKVWKGSSVIKIQTYFILDCTQTDRVKLQENPPAGFFNQEKQQNKTSWSL